MESSLAVRTPPRVDVLATKLLKGGSNAGRFASTEEPLLTDLLDDPMTHR
ncbi:MAG: hypothetical protein HQL37_13095, partial [Alphaproteobacteria bacterium]|nr:hypothetical protein [Alphaproteobacteria bacterium]